MPDAAKLPLEALLLVSAFDVPKLLFPNPLPPVLLRPVEPKPFHPPVLSFFELPPPKPEKPEKPEKPGKPEKPNGNKVPVTGDETTPILWMTLVVMAGAIIQVGKKRLNIIRKNR